MRREYPDAPIVAVGAVIVDEERGGERRVLLTRRGQEPQKGAWSLPGGAVELGESLEEAVRREVLEETGLEVEPVRVVEVLDRILRDAEGRVQYHFVLVDYLCRVTGGALCCGSDAIEGCWVRESALGTGAAELEGFTLEVIRKALEEAPRA